MAAITQLTPDGYGGQRYGSFAGKTPASIHGPHPVGIITRLSLDGYGVRRYGSFAGKTPDTSVPAAPVEEFSRRHGAGVPDRSYAPPHRIVKHELEEAKALYRQAKEEIPKPLQAGLIPARHQIGRPVTTKLPSEAKVDFGGLISDTQAMAALVAAIGDALERKRKRRAEEELLMLALLESMD